MTPGSNPGAPKDKTKPLWRFCFTERFLVSQNLLKIRLDVSCETPLAILSHSRYTRTMISSSSDVSTQSPVKLFLFELDGELFAVSVDAVERVMKIPPITPIPNTPPAILGLFHLRGQVVVVLDLVSRMRMERARPLTANFLFVIARGRDRFAVLVDHPRTIVEVPPEQIAPPDPLILARVPEEYIRGVFLFEDVFVTRKRERQIMFGPAGVNPGNKEESVSVKRPVLWLSVERLLDHTDFSLLFASQRK